MAALPCVHAFSHRGIQLKRAGLSDIRHQDVEHRSPPLRELDGGDIQREPARSVDLGEALVAV